MSKRKKKNKPLDLWIVRRKGSKQKYAIGLCEHCGCWNVFRIEHDETLSFIGEYKGDKAMGDAIELDYQSRRN